ncbi:poly(A) RNA polymerase GLD2-like [Diadema antillarum]|uniref:poly(A) RNA polymerase GLD2-like n=1 Tax=Diadema antillarum TaxID=105358 RepID=UPI003A840194
MSASEVQDRTRDSKQIVSNNYKGLPRSTGTHKRFDIHDSIESQTSDAVAANKLKKNINELRTEGANPKTEQSNKAAGTSSASKAKSDRLHSELMSNKIWTYYQENKQSEQQAIAKECMRSELEACIRRRFPNSDLILGGSSMNGFGSKSCDADLCLCLWDISPSASRSVLPTLRSYLQSKMSNVLLTNMKIIFAKVPILKFKYHHGDVECDLNINHLTGVRNTALLQCYSKMDWRVAPLILIIKQWAKSRGINDASQGTLSSYSYALMIINYLQVGCKPPVLSSLQSVQSGDDLFKMPANIRHYVHRLYDGRKPRNANQSRNTQGLFSLLKGFFEYYAKFHFESTVISVQQGDCYSRFLISPDHPGWKQRFIFIEGELSRDPDCLNCDLTIVFDAFL